jgi:hypothetical protein
MKLSMTLKMGVDKVQRPFWEFKKDNKYIEIMAMQALIRVILEA